MMVDINNNTRGSYRDIFGNIFDRFSFYNDSTDATAFSTMDDDSNNLPHVQSTGIKHIDPEELEILENNAYNKSMHKFIQSFFEILPKKEKRLVIPFKKKRYFKRQNTGVMNFKKAA